MFKFFSKLFDSNQKEINKLKAIVERINALEPKIKKLTDKELGEKTVEFKKRLKKGETLDEILPEAFAVAREAARRTIGLRPFDEQLMASIVLHQGKSAEQKTGEGKTLSAVAPLYLNALSGKGAHLVTVNDYLARRDAGWNGPIFHLLGISVGCLVHEKGLLFDPKYQEKGHDDERLAHLKPVERKEAYLADVTYGTNNEFGFDYLRNNMVQSLERLVQRGHHYAIVDEVDFVLIDEARTPLIISAPDVEPTDKYFQFAKMVKGLTADLDFSVDEKLKTATLTDHGIKKIEKNLGVKNLYEKDFETLHHTEQALRAQTLFNRDVDYVVKDDQVIIVDEFTGRLMFGRRYSEGLHQAIEAKEGVEIQQESKTLATISLQNYFRLYKKLAGMTGTAATEAEEFQKIYGLEVAVLPTHKPMIRADHADVVYKTVRAKYGALAAEVEKCFQSGQPVLLGTRSIEKNNIISDLLKHKKIPHQVLNAKNHEKEASIIAEAGRLKAVTVATNMAGRGVDIVLGGDPVGRKKKDWQKEHKAVIKVGGLHVIGSERHESRRIDNQLRGRSGRQGDPGSSRFYVSLEDEIMRLFGGEQIANLMTTFKMPENIPLEHAMVTRAIEQAQVKVESFHFEARKRLVEYDDVMNKQREIIYQMRRQVFEDPQKVIEKITNIIEREIEKLVEARISLETKEPKIEAISKEFAEILPVDEKERKALEKKINQQKEPSGIKEYLISQASKSLKTLAKEVGQERLIEIGRRVMLTTIDALWMNHLTAIDDLREGISLRGYAQLDPLNEYKQEAFAMFERLLDRVDYEVSRKILRIKVVKQPQPIIPLGNLQFGRQDIIEQLMARQAQAQSQPAQAPQMVTPQSQVTVKPVISGQAKPGRNDPCPCGATKPDGTPRKYKHCCYPKYG